MKKVAVVLSGCGHRDGAEITESVSTLISLSEFGASYQCFAPNIKAQTVDHISGEAQSEKRNVMIESARIARGQVKDLTTLDVDNYDALVFPGGLGAAKNLSTWASDGSSCSMNDDVRRVIEDFCEAGKPIGAICIAPTLVAKVLGDRHITVTIGDDKQTALEIEKTGAYHEDCPATDYITDRESKILTTPAYMNAKNPFEVYTGIRKMIKELVEMA